MHKKEKALRQWKLESYEALDFPLIKEYLAEAIKIKKKGNK